MKTPSNPVPTMQLYSLNVSVNVPRSVYYFGKVPLYMYIENVNFGEPITQFHINQKDKNAKASYSTNQSLTSKRGCVPKASTRDLLALVAINQSGCRFFPKPPLHNTFLHNIQNFPTLSLK